MAKKNASKKNSQGAAASIAQNKKARRDYHIEETFEAGIELKGTEVKSIREGKIHLTDSFARVENNQAWLYGVEISPWQSASWDNHQPKRPRRLLLHKKEILKLLHAQQVKGHTLIALSLYWNKRRVKVEIGVGKGKAAHDKRQDIKKREDQRDMQRAIRQFNQR